MSCNRFTAFILALALIGSPALPAIAQISPDYDFAAKVKKRDYRNVKLMILGHTNLNARDVDGTPALMIAVENGDGVMASMLLEGGADPNITDRKTGEVPLTMAAARNQTDMIDRLLKGGADPNVANKQYETALIKAVNNSNRAAVRLLITAGADVTAQDFTGHDALWYAQNARNRDLLQLLKAPAAKQP